MSYVTSTNEEASRKWLVLVRFDSSSESERHTHTTSRLVDRVRRRLLVPRVGRIQRRLHVRFVAVRGEVEGDESMQANT